MSASPPPPAAEPEDFSSGPSASRARRRQVTSPIWRSRLGRPVDGAGRRLLLRPRPTSRRRRRPTLVDRAGGELRPGPLDPATFASAFQARSAPRQTRRCLTRATMCAAEQRRRRRLHRRRPPRAEHGRRRGRLPTRAPMAGVVRRRPQSAASTASAASRRPPRGRRRRRAGGRRARKVAGRACAPAHGGAGVRARGKVPPGRHEVHAAGLQRRDAGYRAAGRVHRHRGQRAAVPAVREVHAHEQRRRPRSSDGTLACGTRPRLCFYLS